MNMCPDEKLLSEYLDGELKEPWLSQVLEHINYCHICRHQLENLKAIKESTEKAVLDECKIEEAKERTYNYIDKNLFNKKKQSLWRKILNITKKKVFWPILSSVVTFCFCLIILNPGSRKSNIIPYPDVPAILELDNIIPVRTTDNYTTAETLKNYSLEEILQYLNNLGYEVTLKNKEIIPYPIIINEEVE